MSGGLWHGMQSLDNKRSIGYSIRTQRTNRERRKETLNLNSADTHVHSSGRRRRAMSGCQVGSSSCEPVRYFDPARELPELKSCGPLSSVGVGDPISACRHVLSPRCQAYQLTDGPILFLHSPLSSRLQYLQCYRLLWVPFFTTPDFNTVYINRQFNCFTCANLVL